MEENMGVSLSPTICPILPPPQLCPHLIGGSADSLQSRVGLMERAVSLTLLNFALVPLFSRAIPVHPVGLQVQNLRPIACLEPGSQKK